MAIEVERLDPFAIVKLRTHRRTGSNAFVNFGLQRSTLLHNDWANVSPLDWTAFIDPTGNEDGRPETELMEFEIYEFHPDGMPDRAFYRIQSTRKP